jgi:hypothetical protein
MRHRGMRISRGTGLVLAWLVATGLGALIVWIGLRPVLDAAVPDRGVALSAADVRRLATPSPVRAPDPVLPPASGAATGSPHPTSWRPAPVPSSPATPTASPSTRVVDGWTVRTGADGAKTYLRSFKVTGGTAVIGMTPGIVYLISATPSSAYTVRTTQVAASRLVVQFLDGNRADTVDAIWWNGAPYSQIS